MRVHNVSASEAKDILTGAQSVSIADRARYIDSVKDKLDKSQMAEAATFFVPTQAEFTGQALKYLYKRDIDDTVIEHFKLYYTQDWRCNNRIVFPVYDWRGRVVFWTARYIGNELSLGCPKYYMAPGVRKEVVFNTGVFDKKMYIVEGVFDVIRLWILGIANACGIFGTTLTREQAKMLLSCGVSEVCVMLDGDLAGKRGTEVIYQDYSKYFKMSKIQLDGKDPDSIRSKKEMAAYIESEEF
jgi:DNA primase